MVAVLPVRQQRVEVSRRSVAGSGAATMLAPDLFCVSPRRVADRDHCSVSAIFRLVLQLSLQLFFVVRDGGGGLVLSSPEGPLEDI